MKVKNLVTFLNEELDLDGWSDSSHNGLQVGDEARDVRRVCCGVDASLAFFEKAAERGADFLVVHHGISWGTSLSRLTGLNYRWVQKLVQAKLALYACHLPLDAHPELGNNARICHQLGLESIRPFGRYNDREIGFAGVLPAALSRDAFKALIARELNASATFMDFGPDVIESIGVVSGGAAAEVAEAGTEGLDAYVSGEPTLQGYNLAEQWEVNAVFAGHYATERFGVRAVGEMLSSRFGLDVDFIDMGIPF